jgi:hypothetical protein
MPHCIAESTIIYLFSIPWNVLVFDHMLDLTSHGENEQNNKINQQNRPEHRQIKSIK